jgi:hypothetical protein
MSTYQVQFKMIGGASIDYTVDANSEKLAIANAVTKLKKDGYEKYLPYNPEKYAKACIKAHG